MCENDKALLSVVRSIAKGQTLNESIFQNVNWDSFLQLLFHHRFFPLFYKLYKDKIPKKHQEKYRDVYNTFIKDLKYQVEEISSIFAFANKYNIPLILHKGIALSIVIYNSLTDRFGGDIDLLLNDKDIPSFSNILN